MNALAAIPISLWLAILFAAGTIMAGLVNLGVYRLAWNQRQLSPWGPGPPGAPPRGWLDRLPIVGWLRLRREAPIHGAGFWIRPLVVEIAVGAACAALYWWEIDRQALLPLSRIEDVVPALPMGRFIEGRWLSLDLPLAAHLLLLPLILTATLIDIDEQSIPDGITVPGTLLGLILATVLPWSLLPAQVFVVLAPDMPRWFEFLHIASPAPWPQLLGGAPAFGGLALGLLCFEMWCFALLPRTWYARHGIGRALGLCLARIARQRATRLIAAMSVIGAGFIAAIWLRGGVHWVGLLTALTGLAAGGGIIWIVRLIGRAVMHREAMGFGDVTLMAMIGAFVGWQPCLLIFFLAPFAGMVIGVAQLIARRGQTIPYGPFLCLATAVVIVDWALIWDIARNYFLTLGLLIPVLMVACLALMALLLWLIQLLKALLRRA